MVAPRKFYAVAMRKHAIMSAASTESDAVMYTFFDFLSEWVIGASGMRRDENLEHRFEWEDTLESCRARMATKGGVTEPAAPVMTGDIAKDKPAAEAFKREADAYREAVSKASEGEHVYISEAAFKAGADSARDAINAACERGPMGQPRTLPVAYEPKVLRFYHALRQSKPMLESEIPRESDALPS